jgi:hypothetical protein
MTSGMVSKGTLCYSPRVYGILVIHFVVVKKILSQILGRFIVIKRERENIEVMEKTSFLSNTTETKKQ